MQLFYKNSTVEDLPALNITGCGTKCSLDKLKNLLSDIIPTKDFEIECQLPPLSPELKSPTEATTSTMWNNGIKKKSKICEQITKFIAFTFK